MYAVIMGLLKEEDKQTLKEAFEKNLKDPIEITIFLDYEKNKDSSDIAKELINELVSLDSRIKAKFIDARSEDGYKLIKEYRLDIDTFGNKRGPIFLFDKKPGIVYYGQPAGWEFVAFIEDLIAVSRNELELPPKATEKITKVDTPIDIYVFVTPECPYCPPMTQCAHKFAFLNNKIRGIMINAYEFPELAEAFNVRAVPKNVIMYNGKSILEWDGAVPETTFAEYIERALMNTKEL